MKPPILDQSKVVNQSTPAEEWRCFIVDPTTPIFPGGNVTHYKQRLVAGRLETRNVHVHPDRTGSTRINYVRDGDHLQLTWDTGRDVVMLLAPDATRWIRHKTEQGRRQESEEIAIGPGGMTSTAINTLPGGPLATVIHFSRAPCSVVDAELVKHPGPTYQSDPIGRSGNQ